jgi:hypothetical protein
MKATHTGRLKSLDEYFSDDYVSDGHTLSGEEVRALIDMTKEDVELVSRGDGYYRYKGIICINEQYLTDIKPIEPEIETRLFTDEEWREWFLNDGALIHNETGVIWKPISMRKDISFFEYSEDGDRARPVWMSKEKVLERYTDRNGNKFEKKVEK